MTEQIRYFEFIPEDIVDEIITYFIPKMIYRESFLKYADWNWDDIIELNHLNRLSESNKYLKERCRENKVWIDFYRSLFPIHKIGHDSVHIGPQSWGHCRIGEYPGWRRVYQEIPVSVARCQCLHHYDSLENVNKKVRWKNIWKMCVRRVWTLTKKQYRWTSGMEWYLKKRIKELKYMEHSVKLMIRKRDRCEEIPRIYNNILGKDKNGKAKINRKGIGGNHSKSTTVRY